MPQRSISTTSVCPPINSRSAVSLDRDTLPLERDVRQSSAEEPDHRHRRLLRARSDRPRGRPAADKCDEVPPPHGAYPKAKDHGLSIAGLGASSVPCIAAKAAAQCPLRVRSGMSSLWRLTRRADLLRPRLPRAILFSRDLRHYKTTERLIRKKYT